MQVEVQSPNKHLAFVMLCKNNDTPVSAIKICDNTNKIVIEDWIPEGYRQQLTIQPFNDTHQISIKFLPILPDVSLPSDRPRTVQFKTFEKKPADFWRSKRFITGVDPELIQQAFDEYKTNLSPDSCPISESQQAFILDIFKYEKTLTEVVATMNEHGLLGNKI